MEVELDEELPSVTEIITDIEIQPTEKPVPTKKPDQPLKIEKKSPSPRCLQRTSKMFSQHSILSLLFYLYLLISS